MVAVHPRRERGRRRPGVPQLRGGGGEELQVEDLITYCREELAGFKIPKKVAFGPIDKTSTGKVQKYLLREKAEQLEYAMGK